MDKASTQANLEKNKKVRNKNLILTLFIIISLIGIGIGLYFLNVQTIFNSRASNPDVLTPCGPSGHCNDYGWVNGEGYKSVPQNCTVALYKCRVSDWNRALAVGCQKNPSDPSRSLAYYAEIHQLGNSNPDPRWNKVVSGTDGHGHLKPFFPPAECVIWQIDVGGGCARSFHSRLDRRAAICNAPPQTHNICDGTACKQVNGPGSNDCANPGTNPANQCSHKKCENNKCVLVAGGNVDNKCQTDSDCLITPTPTLTPTITPTPQSCPVPSPVTNLKIVCPICSGTQ